MRISGLLPPVRSVADQTPETRDRVLDVVRAFVLVVVAVALSTFAACAALVYSGPPSVVLLVQGMTVVSLAGIARGPLERLLQRPRAWRTTTAVTMPARNLYTWHLLGIVLPLATLRAAGLAPPTHLDARGLTDPLDTGGYARWFLGVFLAFFVALVLLTWPTPYGPPPLPDTPSRHSVLPAGAPGWLHVLLVVVAGLMVGAGILVLSLTGFAGFPLHDASWSGVTLIGVVGIALLLGDSLLMRSIAGQPHGGPTPAPEAEAVHAARPPRMPDRPRSLTGVR